MFKLGLAKKAVFKEELLPSAAFAGNPSFFGGSTAWQFLSMFNDAGLQPGILLFILLGVRLTTLRSL